MIDRFQELPTNGQEPLDANGRPPTDHRAGMTDKEAAVVQARLWAIGVEYCPVVVGTDGTFSVQVWRRSDDDDSLMFTITSADVPTRGW